MPAISEFTIKIIDAMVITFMMSFFEQHAIYVVLVIALVIWLGLAFYVNKLDGSVKQLEQHIK